MAAINNNENEKKIIYMYPLKIYTCIMGSYQLEMMHTLKYSFLNVERRNQSRYMINTLKRYNMRNK